MKRQIKRLAEDAVARIAPLAWRTRSAPQLLVLMYHRVLPPDHPDRRTEQPGMYVSPGTLAMHLVELRRRGFSILRLDEWLARAANGEPLPPRACAITFDDGWRDNYDHAFPVLKSAQAPATIYLVSELIGSRYSFWPNSLARALARCTPAMLGRMPDWLCEATVAAGGRSGPLSAAAIDSVIGLAKTSHADAEMLSVVQRLGGNETISGERDLLSWPEVHEMQASGFVTFGSHTRRHTRLTDALASEVMADEVLGSMQTLERQLGARPHTFCYPNGDTCPAAIALVKKAYVAALTTQPGWHNATQDPFLIRRMGVHEDVANRPAAFLARISGWI